MVRTPVIGITATPYTDVQTYGTFERLRLTAGYGSAVERANGAPIILPPQDDAVRLLDAVDGLLLSGGADVDPALYGDADVHPETYEINPQRDQFELALVRGALERDLPVLCVCRGLQVLNVALGGTLVQHIPDGIPDALSHRQHERSVPVDESSHRVSLANDGRLARIYGASEIEVNSLHHQAVGQIGADLVIEAVAPDGVIEGLSRPQSRFLVGIQWHPELMYETAPEHHQPFVQLVREAACFAEQRKGFVSS